MNGWAAAVHVYNCMYVYDLKFHNREHDTDFFYTAYKGVFIYTFKQYLYIERIYEQKDIDFFKLWSIEIIVNWLRILNEQKKNRNKLPKLKIIAIINWKKKQSYLNLSIIIEIAFVAVWLHHQYTNCIGRARERDCLWILNYKAHTNCRGARVHEFAQIINISARSRCERK